MQFSRLPIAIIIFCGGILYAVAQDYSSEEGGTLLDEPEVDRGISNDSFSGVSISSPGDKTTNFSNGTTTQLPAVLVPEEITLSTIVEAAVTWQVPVSIDNRNEMPNSTETPVNNNKRTSTDVVTTSTDVVTTPTEIVTTSQKSIPPPSGSPESNTTSIEADGGYVEETTEKLVESDNNVGENGQNEAISLNPAAFPWNFLLLSFILFHN